jgi:hypothetical protein
MKAVRYYGKHDVRVEQVPDPAILNPRDAADQAADGQSAPGLMDYAASSRFWFESFQNWQSEFLSVGVMVWLGVYLRQRWSPESKAVHASHSETGR